MTGGKPDERIRTPYPWTAEGPGFGFTTGTPWEPFSDGAETANLATERADPASTWSTYRDLVQLRVQHQALRAGEYVRVKASDRHVAAWIRTFGEERLLVVHNLGDQPLENVELSLDAGPLCGTTIMNGLYTTGGVPAGARPPTVTAAGGFDNYVPLPLLPPRFSIVLEFEP